ncbi:exopolysaccharide biosynthesis protein [Enhydrobacter sp.]|uniref:exopolysaccharide biosynthesis protein n=1 Tax=Enhydrobacter sp. TaxID=1894999 RepID=UPI00262BE6F7|nr:exopolysaccharide biosynthesis protein [Enhydrobacter sp.]
MAQDRAESSVFLPTSVHLARILDRAEQPRVSVGWLMQQLGERSFGLTLFMMAVIAFIPGASTVMGVLIAWPAVQMMLGHDVAALPRLIVRKQIGVERLARIIGIVAPRLEWIERLVRPRWRTPFETTKRLTGAVMLLLGLSLISPVPFSHILPALVIMLLALAYLEEDGVALVVALIAALASLAATGAMLWGTVETIDWIDPATPG